VHSSSRPRIARRDTKQARDRVQNWVLPLQCHRGHHSTCDCSSKLATALRTGKVTSRADTATRA
jgi:hypothetical protein